MTYDQQAAQAKISAWLDLPRIVAGANSRALDAALDEVDLFKPSEREFGPLLGEANTARDTVHSALLALRDAAIQREQEARP